MPPKKATVDKGTTIRAASRNKQRPAHHPSSSASPFGSSSASSLASSLSSLFVPQPHGKDAALASLLGSSSKLTSNLGQAAGLAAFGSFTQPQSHATSASVQTSLDDRQKGKKKDVSTRVPAPSVDTVTKHDIAGQQEATASGSKQPDAHVKNDRVQKHSKGAVAATSGVPPNRKPVFRPVLASSTAVSWPEMPVAGSKVVLHTLLEVLAKADVQAALYRDLGRRSRAGSSKPGEGARGEDMDIENGADKVAHVQVLAGINSITRAIEDDIARDLARIQTNTSEAKGKQAQTEAAPPSVRIVFVCRHDLPSPSLVSHLPMLVAARNAVLHASQPDLHGGVLLFPLPSASEPLLAQALNLRRTSIFALTTAFPPHHLDHLLSAIQRETCSTCLPRAAWLETAILSSTSSQTNLNLLQRPTSIKLLRTTQPTDLNACKAAKRTRRKERSVRWKRKKMAALQQVKGLERELKMEERKRRASRRVGATSQKEARA
ncbi:hypothetical protein PHSY_005134 [Pseudozyma hubeiensis SY62]|uniref:Uncharacterized protein n=1 Tax=Pseudozyma hubeiensis (strain SY62) TaxID=1305764 RepID=R9P821_PSEHS|nr:hypothetical protein PHSY_005134 [Pseudozyma hubeiensis SY62]GAC97548.1 hypothetical protein PHSY_005134 [Pseudozyma hubeiensis SY62]